MSIRLPGLLQGGFGTVADIPLFNLDALLQKRADGEPNFVEAQGTVRSTHEFGPTIEFSPPTNPQAPFDLVACPLRAVEAHRVRDGEDQVAGTADQGVC